MHRLIAGVCDMQGVHLLIDGCADARQPLIDLERG